MCDSKIGYRYDLYGMNFTCNKIILLGANLNNKILHGFIDLEYTAHACT